MSDSPPTTAPDNVLYCANHPTTETTLRCNRCEKPICAKCAVLTPTGYRCKECVRGQQKVFDTAEARDFLIAVPLAGILGFIGGLIIPNLWYFTFFVSPAAGAFFAEIIRRSIQRRRSKRLFQFAAAAVLIGGLLPICASTLGVAAVMSLGQGAGGAGSLLGGVGLDLLWQGIYAFMAASTAYYRLSGLQL